MCIKISRTPMQPTLIINVIKTDIRSLLFVDMVTCISSEIQLFDSINSDSVVRISRFCSCVMLTRKVGFKECPSPVVPSDLSKYRDLYEMS